jgi:hypothetical protein
MIVLFPIWSLGSGQLLDASSCHSGVDILIGAANEVERETCDTIAKTA